MNDQSDKASSPLAAFLLAPSRQATLFEAAGLWQESHVSIRCQAPPRFGFKEEHAWRLPGTIRGAWGNQLKQGASEEARQGNPCPWNPPCALDALMRCQGMITPAMEIPKPWTLSVDLPRPGELAVSLILFGVAGEWKGAVTDALVRALRKGLYLGDGPRAAPLSVEDVSIVDYQGVDITEASMRAEMEFITPISIRQENDLQLSASQIIMSLSNRISGLARWLGLELTDDFRAISDAVAGIDWAEEDIRRIRWKRRSNPQRKGDIPMEGLLGRVHIRGALLGISPILAIGQTCLAGGRTAWGQGRYKLTWR